MEKHRHDGDAAADIRPGCSGKAGITERDTRLNDLWSAVIR